MNSDWSIKIQVGGGGVQGYNEFELVYSATQTTYRLTQNTGSITGQAPIVLNHVSDDAAPIHARLVESNKLGTFELIAYDDASGAPDWDIILNNVHRLARLMSGATSTATRHTVTGAADEVRLAIKPKGATNTTYFTIQSGSIDTSSVYYTAGSQNPSDTKALLFPINFTFTEAGYGETITLNNALASSPHFVEDSNSDGLADGWNETGTPTSTIDTDSYLIGGKSQEFITDNSTKEGIYSDTVTIAATTDGVCYAWVATGTTSADPLTVELTAGSGASIQSKTITFNADGTESSSVSDKHLIGPGGLHWYRVVVSGSDGANADMVAWIYRAVGDASKVNTYFVDAVYLETGTLTAPDGWCSTSALKNRYDPDVAEANINYHDVWGIPGDLPALVKTDIDTDKNTADTSVFIIGKSDSRVPEATDSLYIFEFERFADIPAQFATVVDGTRSSGEYKRNTNAGATETNGFTFPAAEASSLFQASWRVYALMRSAAITSTVTVQISNIVLGTKSNNVANTWEIVDYGLLNGVGQLNQEAIDLFTEAVNITCTASAASNIDLDCLFFMPVNEYIIFNPSRGGDLVVTMNGKDRDVYYDDESLNLNYIGAMWKCLPHETSRRIYLMHDTDLAHDLTVDFDITLTVTPRASHLLGTL